MNHQEKVESNEEIEEEKDVVHGDERTPIQRRCMVMNSARVWYPPQTPFVSSG